MYLNEATNEHIKQYADILGYEFTDEDVNDVRATGSTWYGREDMISAVNDYLNAFES